MGQFRRDAAGAALAFPPGTCAGGPILQPFCILEATGQRSCEETSKEVDSGAAFATWEKGASLFTRVERLLAMPG